MAQAVLQGPEYFKMILLPSESGGCYCLLGTCDHSQESVTDQELNWITDQQQTNRVGTLLDFCLPIFAQFLKSHKSVEANIESGSHP